MFRNWIVVFDKFSYLHCSLALVLGCIIFCWLKNRWLNLPPGPRGLPIVGCIPFVESHAEKTLATWSKTYGPIMTVDLASTRNVVLNSYEAIEEAFIRQSSSFSSRYSTFLTRITCEDKGIAGVWDLSYWKVQRSFGSRALYGRRGIREISIEDKILHEAEAVCDVIRQKNGQPFVLETELMYFVANVISGIVANERCIDNEDMREMIHQIVNGFREDSFLYSLLTFSSWSRFLPFLQKNLRRFKSQLSFEFDLMDKLIEQHQQRFDPKAPRDMIDLFLIEHKQQNYTFEDLRQLRYYLRDMFIAGTETTTSTIRWVLFYLIKHPEIQQKIHQEIEYEIGSEGKVKLNLVLPYTRAVIQESYRIQPPAPLSLPRKTTKDVSLMGYRIPNNTQIFANIFAVHYDPGHFPEPKKFIPERHLDDKGKFVKSNRIIPFSTGSRNCLGENLARSEVFLFIVTMLQKFEVLPHPKNPNPDMEGVAGLVNSPPHYPIIMQEK